jgi:hypothetical protein
MNATPCSIRVRRLARLLPYALSAAIAFLLVSCGKDGEPVSPGGGSTGSTPPAPFNFSFPQTGHSEQLAFPNAGVFGYHCRQHGGSGMTGGVTVNAVGLDSIVVSVGQGGNMFSPSAVTIKPGGTVRWVNVSSRSDHTVTSD